MKWEDYKEGIKEFCIYPDAGEVTELELSYLTLGLASEAGEVAGLMKKELRDQPEFDADKWKGELGDCVWYLTRLCDCFGFTLEEVMEYNYNKLASRKERNTLTGHGDNR